MGRPNKSASASAAVTTRCPFGLALSVARRARSGLGPTPADAAQPPVAILTFSRSLVAQPPGSGWPDASMNASSTDKGCTAVASDSKAE